MAANTPPGPPSQPNDDDKKKKPEYLTTDNWLSMTPPPKKAGSKSEPSVPTDLTDDDLVLIDDIPPPTLPQIELPPSEGGYDPMDSKTLSRLIDVPDPNTDSTTMSRLIDVPSDVWNKLALAGAVPPPTAPPPDDEPSTQILPPPLASADDDDGLDFNTLPEPTAGGSASFVGKKGPKTAPVDPADAIAHEPLAPPGVGSGWMPSGTKMPRTESTADIDLPPTKHLRDEPSDIFSTAKPPRGGSSDLFGGNNPPSAGAGSDIFADATGAPVPGGKSDIFADPSRVITGGESDLFAHLPGVMEDERGSSLYDDPARKTERVPYPPPTPRPDPFGGMVQLDLPPAAGPGHTASSSGPIEIIDTGTGFTGRHVPLPLSASDLPTIDPLADMRPLGDGPSSGDLFADMGAEDEAPRRARKASDRLPQSDPLPVPLPRSDPEMPDFDDVDRDSSSGSNLFGDATVLDMELGMPGMSGVNLGDPEGSAGGRSDPQSSIFSRGPRGESDDRVDFAEIPVMGSSDDRTESMLFGEAAGSASGPASGIFHKGTVPELGDLDDGEDDGAGVVSFDDLHGKGGSRRMPFQDSGGVDWSLGADADQRTMAGADGEDSDSQLQLDAMTADGERTSRTKVDDESVFSAGDIDPVEFGLPPDPVDPAETSSASRLRDTFPSSSRAVSVASRDVPVTATRRPAVPPTQPKGTDTSSRSGQPTSGGGSRGLLLAGLGLVAGGLVGAGGMYLGNSGGTPETKTGGPSASLNPGTTVPPAAGEMPAAALIAADPAAALAAFLKEGDSPAAQAGRGQARWLARARAEAEANRKLNPADPELTQAKADLRAVLTAAATLPADQQKYAVQAGLHLGLIEEATARPEQALAVYREAAGLLPPFKKVFDAAVQRVTIMRKGADNSKVPDENYSALPVEPATDLALATLLVTFDPVQEIDDEPGFHFWEAVNLSAGYLTPGKLDQALASLKKARDAHAVRRKTLAGRGLNPLSDPSEQMFLRACDELRFYWMFKRDLYKDADVVAMAKKPMGTGQILAELVQAKKAGGGANPKELEDAKAAVAKAKADQRTAEAKARESVTAAELKADATIDALKRVVEKSERAVAAADANLDAVIAKLKDVKLIDPAADRATALAALPEALKKAAVIGGGSGDKMAELADALAKARADAEVKVKDAEAKLKDADARAAAAKDAETKAKADAAEAMKGGDAKLATAVKAATEKAEADAKKAADAAIAAERTKATEAVAAAARAEAAAKAEMQKADQKLAAMTADFTAQISAARTGATVRLSEPERAAADRGEKLYADGVRAYFEGRFAEAEGYLAGAVRESEADARGWYFLGLSKFAVGRTGEAATDFRTGAGWEAKSKPSRRAVATALERVQGPARQAVESVRP